MRLWDLKMPKSELKIVDGTKKWYLNGKLHREDGPAVERADGTKVWYLNGERHREDGPAIEWSAGDKSWYLNGEKLTKEEFNLAMDIKRTKDKKRAILYRTSRIAKVCYEVMGV